MKMRLYRCLCVLALLVAGNQALAQSFDLAYTVDSIGSTTPRTTFAIDGPAPVLFLDLPGTSFITFASSDWFRNPDASLQFNVQQSAFGGERFWLTPTAADWAAKKAVGDWHINARFEFVDLQCAENGGICVGRTVGSGSGVVAFGVTAAPVAAVPEPGSYALLMAGLGVIGVAARRRQRPSANASSARAAP